MAIRAMLSRNVTWVCKNCGENNIKAAQGQSTNNTTMTAEKHSDDFNHNVVAIGQIIYNITKGATPTDDPFAPNGSD